MLHMYEKKKTNNIEIEELEIQILLLQARIKILKRESK